MVNSFSDISSMTTSFVDRTKCVALYLKDIYKFPILTPEEEIELIYKTKNGDEKAREQLFNCNQRFVFAIAKRILPDENVLDLVSVGNLGLNKAIKMFDPTVGTRFLSYAVWCIRSEINLYLNYEYQLIKKSNNKVTSKINQIRNKNYCEFGTALSDEEIIKILKDEYNIELTSLENTGDITVDSINSTYDDGSAESSVEFSTMYNIKTAMYNDYENKIEKESDKKLATDFLSILNERERTILQMYFGFKNDKEYSFKEIGEEFGITSERVRQIVNKSISKLQKSKKFVLSMS